MLMKKVPSQAELDEQGRRIRSWGDELARHKLFWPRKLVERDS